MDALEKRLKRRKRIFDKFFKSVNHHFFVTDKNYLKLMKLNRELDGLVQRGGVERCADAVMLHVGDAVLY